MSVVHVVNSTTTDQSEAVILGNNKKMLIFSKLASINPVNMTTSVDYLIKK